MKFRIITRSDIGRHPARSFAVEDYIFSPGDRVVLRRHDAKRATESRIVVRQDGNDLWLAKVEYMPGSKTPFCCSLAEQTTVFGVRRIRG